MGKLAKISKDNPEHINCRDNSYKVQEVQKEVDWK